MPVPHPATTNAAPTSPMVFFTSEPTFSYSCIKSLSSLPWSSTASLLERPTTTNTRRQYAVLRFPSRVSLTCNRILAYESAPPSGSKLLGLEASSSAACRGVGVCTSLNSIRENAAVGSKAWSFFCWTCRAHATLSAVSDCNLLAELCCPYTVSGKVVDNACNKLHQGLPLCSI